MAFAETGEEVVADHGHGLREHQLHPVVKCLRAHDAVLTRVDYKAAKAGVALIFFVPLWQEVPLVHRDAARDVGLASQRLDLLQHHFLVGLYRSRDSILDFA